MISKALKLLFLLIVFSLASALCMASDTPVLNLAELPMNPAPVSHPVWALQGTFVQVRGFWTPISSDQGILTAFPDLKSCCIKAPAKIHQQLVVKGEIASLAPQRAATLEGIFKIEPSHNSNGEVVQYYVLEQAKEATGHKSNLLIWTSLSLACLLLASKIYRKRMN